MLDVIYVFISVIQLLSQVLATVNLYCILSILINCRNSQTVQLKVQCLISCAQVPRIQTLFLCSV